ncbi:MAG: hypothetical protein UZ20_WS6002000924 [candidate division WS6 bacterium OLB21]|uniref:Uncharacterized protein n=1 Tax=candidate division WS6 bacterium OLB21 TaxID=1617427 RepID=A0A136KG42_9BACT|nr:MAG: hypothetical protein UZ20_WS6002000924 [candidate division WS6 bacterium OLB21]
MKRINKTLVIIIVHLTVLIAAVFAVYNYDFKQGIDFDNSRAVQISFESEVNRTELADFVNTTLPYERFDNSGNRVFRVYYQNAEDEKVDDLIERIQERFGTITETVKYNSNPGNLFIFAQQRIEASVWIYLLGVVIFVLFTFRKKGFLIIDLLEYMLAQLAGFMWFAAILVLLTVVLNELGVAISYWYLSGLIAASAIAFLFMLIVITRLLSRQQTEKPNSLFEEYTLLLKEENNDFFKSGLLASTIFLGLVILPYPQLTTLFVVLLSVLLALVMQTTVVQSLLMSIHLLSTKIKLNKRIRGRW